MYELTGAANRVGNSRLELKDAADGYYGLGQRFNELNYTRQIIRNGSHDNAPAKGSAAYKPIPFYLSTSGYGLWVDTTAGAVFDRNASSGDDVVITVPAQKLHIGLIQGPEFPHILDRFTAMEGRSMLPPFWSFAPGSAAIITATIYPAFLRPALLLFQPYRMKVRMSDGISRENNSGQPVVP